jgi:HSP20 family protein
MVSVVRYTPFEDSFDELMRGFLVRPLSVEASRQVQIKVDVSEDDKAYKVLAELPGVSKDEIQVSIEDNEVAISAEVKREKETKENGKTLRSERYYGKVYRAFSLAQDVDEAGAKASYTNGVLELTLPKKAATSARRLTIQIVPVFFPTGKACTVECAAFNLR